MVEIVIVLGMPHKGMRLGHGEEATHGGLLWKERAAAKKLPENKHTAQKTAGGAGHYNIVDNTYIIIIIPR